MTEHVTKTIEMFQSHSCRHSSGECEPLARDFIIHSVELNAEDEHVIGT